MIRILQSTSSPLAISSASRSLQAAVGICAEDFRDHPRIRECFVESVLLYLMGQTCSMGFVVGTHNARFAASWIDQGTHRPCWGEINLRERTYATDAPGDNMMVGFGLVGMGLAMIDANSGFREAWMAYLAHADKHVGLSALTPARLGPIAVAIGDACVAHDPPEGNGSGWLLRESGVSQRAPLVLDVKDHLLTASDFVELLDLLDRTPADQVQFQGPQLAQLRSLIRRRKHTVLLGPPGSGKSSCAFEALDLERFITKGVDYQLFMGHDDVKAADLLGAWQPTESPGLFRWAPGPLVRAMTARDGKGQPILVEEFLRMPRRAQNIFITALSDGYLVLNEKPDEHGAGELIEAGPDFVFLADMNIDAAADDLEPYGAALASRVRKIAYGYPDDATLSQILADAMPAVPSAIRAGVVGTYSRVMKRFESREVSAPISPRACLHWMEEIADDVPASRVTDSTVVRAAASIGAELTWITDVVGFDSKDQQPLRDDVEAQFRKAFGI